MIDPDGEIQNIYPFDEDMQKLFKTGWKLGFKEKLIDLETNGKKDLLKIYAKKEELRFKKGKRTKKVKEFVKKYPVEQYVISGRHRKILISTDLEREIRVLVEKLGISREDEEFIELYIDDIIIEDLPYINYRLDVNSKYEIPLKNIPKHHESKYKRKDAYENLKEIMKIMKKYKISKEDKNKIYETTKYVLRIK